MERSLDRSDGRTLGRPKLSSRGIAVFLILACIRSRSLRTVADAGVCPGVPVDMFVTLLVMHCNQHNGMECNALHVA